MVRTRGPALSLDASGSVGQAVTHSSWKGRSYVKRKRLKEAANFDIHGPHQLMMAWLAREWNQLADVDKITWRSLAAPEHVPDYNAFMGHNLQRFHNFKPPTKRFPAGEVLTPPAMEATYPKANGRIHSMLATVEYDALNDPWGFYLFINPDDNFTPTLAHLCWIGTKTNVDEADILIRNLEPGDYWIKAATFTPDGVMAIAADGQLGTVVDY